MTSADNKPHAAMSEEKQCRDSAILIAEEPGFQLESVGVRAGRKACAERVIMTIVKIPKHEVAPTSEAVSGGRTIEAARN